MSVFEVVCKECGSKDVELSNLIMTNGKVRTRGKCNSCNTSDNLFMNESNNDFKMPFGKYQGMSIAEIVEVDEQYANWVVTASSLPKNIKERFEAEI